MSNAPAGPSLMHVSNHVPLTCLKRLTLGLILMRQHAPPSPFAGSLTAAAFRMVISTLHINISRVHHGSD